MKPNKTFDHERVSFNVARLKKNGETFEVVVDPDAAIHFKETGQGTLQEVMKAEKVFHDAKKGLFASPEKMQATFDSDAFEIVAQYILDNGEIQLTTEHRDKIRQQKLLQMITKIHREAIDPKSGNPHPEQRIKLAFDEAKIHVNEMQSTEKQFSEIVRKLQPILPLKFESVVLSVKVPHQYAGNAHHEIARITKVLKQDWLSDGSWQGEVELPAGQKIIFTDKMASMTHGVAIVEEKR